MSREELRRMIDAKLRSREVYLAHGSVLDAERCNDQIAAIERQIDELDRQAAQARKEGMK
jgi:hypothetical protein